MHACAALHPLGLQNVLRFSTLCTVRSIQLRIYASLVSLLLGFALLMYDAVLRFLRQQVQEFMKKGPQAFMAEMVSSCTQQAQQT
jgi:hypothetical protein